VRTAPRGAERYCWRIDVVPRLVHLAGLELGAGVGLNIVARLRKPVPQADLLAAVQTGLTPAPLGTLAEWFWGVLGIPKNMIGFGEGEKKEEPALPPKTPAK